MKRFGIACLFAVCVATVRMPAQAPVAADPFKGLGFLEQNWEANTNGFNGVKSTGTYAFRRELGGHILARVTTSGIACKGPADFDCGHNDSLQIFQDAPGQPLKAIYFDNEGHVIHYDVTMPTATSVEFLSAPGPGPQFRLGYELKDGLLVGKFQMRMGGVGEWKSYLEWSGGKK